MECVGEGKGMEGNRWEDKKEEERVQLRFCSTKVQ